MDYEADNALAKVEYPVDELNAPAIRLRAKTASKAYVLGLACFSTKSGEAGFVIS